jgi:hypothetical protein
MLRVDGGDGPDSVVVTSQPVSFRDRTGDLRKIDLSLERSGDELVTRTSPFGLKLPDALDQGISVGSGDRQFSIRPEVSNAADAAIEQYAAFYGDVDPDTDFVAKPVVGGVETFSILRSPASPEELRFRVSAGAGSELRPADLADGFVLSQGDQDLALVSPPLAWDAQHRPVAVAATVDGEDLVLQVAHRDRDVAYPIVVDPTVIDTCWLYISMTSGCQADAWETTTDPKFAAGTPGWAYSGDSRFGSYVGGGYLGTGLYIRNLVNNYYNNNEAGYWFYRAPTGVRIYQALFANLSQDNTSDNTSCLFVGVLSGTGNWEPNAPATFCAQQTYDAAWTWTPTGNPYYRGGGTEGNSAIFGAMAQRTGWSSYWMDHMGGVAIGLQEMNYSYLVPYISSPDFPDGWQTDPNRFITFHAGDAGLGIRTITFSSPENPAWQAIDADTGAAANKVYDWCTGGARLACPMDVWMKLKLGNLREGYSTIRATVTDIVGKTYTYQHTIAIQGGGPVDSFPPNLALSGPAVDNAARLDTGAWDLEVAATDGAGIATIATVIDGTTDETRTFNSCAGCGVDAEFTIDTEDLVPGGHSIRVIAADRRGNQVTKTLTASVSRTAAMSSLSTLGAMMSTDYSEPPACADAPPFTPYYAGATVAGFRLTYSVSSCAPPAESGDPGAHSVSYGYGTCDATVDSCGTPVTITSRPLCEAHAKLYRDESGLELAHTSPTLKGVPAASYNNATTTDLYTGTTTISINSASASVTTAIVNAIRAAPATDVPAAGLPLLTWPAASGTTAATTLDAPDTTMLNATEARC